MRKSISIILGLLVFVLIAFTFSIPSVEAQGSGEFDLSITNPKEGDKISKENITIEWNGPEDPKESLIKINESAEWVNTDTKNKHTISNIKEEEYTVKVRIIGWEDGKMDTDSVNFAVDYTKPDLTIVSPQKEDAKISENQVLIAWKGRDKETSIDHYEIRLDGSRWEDMDMETDTQLYGLFDGRHTVKVKAVDEAGNEQVKTNTFTVNPETSTSESSTYEWGIIGTLIGVLILGIIATFLIHKRIKNIEKIEKKRVSKSKPKKKIKKKK